MTHSIWFDADPLNLPKPLASGLVETIGIELIEAGADFLTGKMPVDDRTRQPFGLLHGGASVVLAETLASMASIAVAGPAKACVGLEINANHVRGVREGWVFGTARPLHLGRTTHVWDIRIADQQDRPVCVSRCTVSVINQGSSRAQQLAGASPVRPTSDNA